MKKVIITLLLFFVSQLINAQVGTWKNYLSYHDIQQIQAAGDDIFVLASNGLYQYNQADQSITTYDKTNGLSDTNISLIAWCKSAKRLIAVYSNANIDLVETNGNVTNISDLHSKAITGDKTVNSITIDGQYAYLSCGFGIVKLNVKNAEVSESYMFNHNIKKVAVNSGNIYAQLTDTKTTLINETPVIPYQGNINLDSLLQARYKTETVVYYAKAPLTTNLIDKSNWELIFEDLSSLFTDDNTDYEKYYETVSKLNPGGPKYNYFGYMKYKYGRLYTSSGTDLQGCIQELQDGEWKIYQNTDLSSISGLKSFKNIRALDVDPNNYNHLFAGSRNGLYEFLDGNLVKHYGNENSPIEPFDGKSAEYQLLYGVLIDDNRTLWCLNSQAPTKSLLSMNLETGEWKSYDLPEIMILNDGGIANKSLPYMQNMIVDNKKNIWFVNNFWNTSSVHRFFTDNNGNINLKSFTSFVNQNGVTVEITSGITGIAEDRNGDMWIVTSAGPLLLEKDQMESDNPIFKQVIVPRNDGTNLGDYLLSGITTTCVDIDDGNRKWFGTLGNGVFVISDDNMEQIHHFTNENSPLLSNNIESLAINHKTGEVFIGTDKGLCSYMNDATTTFDEMTKDNVYAYPNPVTPDYNGLITIVGLTYNADVKILNSNGKLINQGRSNGGTFTWNGCDEKGNRVASGVYMVVTATNSGQKGTVCKIAIIR